MPEQTKIYLIHALTPLHVGAGRGVRFIDLPVMREKVTGWPMMPGSTAKGVIADHHGATEEARQKDEMLRAAFGIADSGTPTGGMPNAGSLVFTDARIVCLPVRSLYGTFAWITSPLALKRFYRDLEAANQTDGLSMPKDPGQDKIFLGEVSSSVLCQDEEVFLEDHDFKSVNNKDTAEWAKKLAEWIFREEESWKEEFRYRFAVVSDGAFDFFCETGTEVTPRVRIEEKTKTVQEGALWYEESLPAETMLAGLVWCDRVLGSKNITQDKLMKHFCQKEIRLQMGGKATIGKGRVRIIFGKE
jgi:CRISPR-associated protein Cmr4